MHHLYSKLSANQIRQCIVSTGSSNPTMADNALSGQAALSQPEQTVHYQAAHSKPVQTMHNMYSQHSAKQRRQCIGQTGSSHSIRSTCTGWTVPRTTRAANASSGNASSRQACSSHSIRSACIGWTVPKTTRAVSVSSDNASPRLAVQVRTNFCPHQCGLQVTHGNSGVRCLKYTQKAADWRRQTNVPFMFTKFNEIPSHTAT